MIEILRNRRFVTNNTNSKYNNNNTYSLSILCSKCAVIEKKIYLSLIECSVNMFSKKIREI